MYQNHFCSVSLFTYQNRINRRYVSLSCVSESLFTYQNQFVPVSESLFTYQNHSPYVSESFPAYKDHSVPYQNHSLRIIIVLSIIPYRIRSESLLMVSESFFTVSESFCDWITFAGIILESESFLNLRDHSRWYQNQISPDPDHSTTHQNHFRLRIILVKNHIRITFAHPSV